MDDAQRLAAGAQALVRVVQPGGRGGDDGDRVAQRQGDVQSGSLSGGGARVLAQDLAHVRAVHVLHREERRLAVGADVVDLDHVGVIERRRQARLVQEHAQQLGIEGVLRQDPLEHDQLLEPLDADAGEAGEVDLRHSADGQTSERLVPPDSLAAVEQRGDSHPASGYQTRGDPRNPASPGRNRDRAPSPCCATADEMGYC